MEEQKLGIRALFFALNKEIANKAKNSGKKVIKAVKESAKAFALQSRYYGSSNDTLPSIAY